MTLKFAFCEPFLPVERGCWKAHRGSGLSKVFRVTLWQGDLCTDSRQLQARAWPVNRILAAATVSVNASENWLVLRTVFHVKTTHCPLFGPSFQNLFCIFAPGSLLSSWINEEILPNWRQLTPHRLAPFPQLFSDSLYGRAGNPQPLLTQKVQLGNKNRWGDSVPPVSFPWAG